MKHSVLSKIGTLTAAAVTVAVLVPATASAAVSALNWGACPEDVAAPGVECGTLKVPLDYRNPGGATIDIAVSKLSSTKPAKRRGIMLTNPGGPGGPGLTMPAGLRAAGMPSSVLDAYDVIGFDPRGIGRSTPVTCDLKPGQQTGNVPPYARDEAAVAERATYVAGIAKQCGESKTAANLPYITTANTARDMDRIREALGEKKLSYYGVSYGSYLGAVYSTMFPQQTDRVVIDSVTSPGGLDPATSRRLAEGFEDRFPDFAKWAAARHASYGLGRTPRQVTAKFYELAAKLDTGAVPGIDGATFRASTFGALYSTRSFPILAQQWQGLDGEGVLKQAAETTQIDLAQLLSGQLHVVCNDTNWPEDVATYQRNVAKDRVKYPMFGAAGANIWACASWPSEPIEPPVRIGDRGPSNILMVQNLRDPATPLSGARDMRRALGDRARIVTVDEGGHGVWLSDENACGNNAVNRFFVEGKRPAHDTACGVDKGGLFDSMSPQQRQDREKALDEVRSKQRVF
ncbi:alpha/beta hydrolase [Amycolatopsis regifaucium]|uniref:Hydrolase n=1 Tax=Amycolatopsis regifaucium TaxID=546365 RepID=A0A154MSM2_9PSEU|nr:alpha/beta hydrolase [Amycolatopsis regifaucium]KZB87245.1 hydrolase [Amycolatopsis regifaucium]OKA08076.1 hydrolase [Amycolatopsis regifaucium]SFI38740.1 TAP-like protein [Amycolatopsis regifaucium]